MNSFETSAIVEQPGQIHVCGIPFAPGTEVEITIREKVLADAATSSVNIKEARASIRELFDQVKGRNTEPIGPLRREELYDRQVLRGH